MIRQIFSLLLLFLSTILTFNFSTFTHPFFVFIAPGFLFGIALTLPNIYPNFKSNMKQIRIILAYPVLWATCLSLSMVVQIITPLQSDKIPYILIGLLSGLIISIIYDWQFGFKKRSIAFICVIVLSIISFLLGDSLFPHSHEKELNIGKQVAIWQILVGFGLLLNHKTIKATITNNSITNT